MSAARSLFASSAALCLLLGSAYNLSLKPAWIFSMPVSERASYFGYSLALYVGPGRPIMLIGAPRANSSRPADEREHVFEPGAVYWCWLDEGTCDEWLLDSVQDNRIFGTYTPIRQRKDAAWLGATLSVEADSPTPRIAVCAPNWKQNVRTSRDEWWWFMNGMCYSIVASNSSFWNDEPGRYFPLMDQDQQLTSFGSNNLYYYGMGQAGFAVHIAPGTHSMALGAPGVFHWTGSAILIEEAEDSSRNSFRALVPKLIGDSRFDFDDYFGYSITSGKFIGEERLYASGAPRSAVGHGKVYVFAYPRTKGAPLLIKRVLTGEQYGEYFGASLAACDVNSDGRDDLVVGAPLWSSHTDEGRVYAFVSEGQSQFRSQSISGEQPSARFGTALSCLGDLDQDGYADLAVGAPYESEGRGAIYIYNGGVRGLSGQPSQRVGAEELDPTLRGFGISLSDPARDVDRNGCADLAVGAYASDQAVLLLCRPVVRPSVRLSLLDEDAVLAENSTSHGLNVCAHYDGPLAPDTMDVLVLVKIEDFHKRAFFKQARSHVETYEIRDNFRKGQHSCSPLTVYLKENVQNMIEPIKVAAIIIDPGCAGCPVVDPSSKMSDTLMLAYALDCGPDNACTSDLRLRLSSSLALSNNSYAIGSKVNVNITILVSNAREPAYRAEVHLRIPEPIALARLPLECEEQAQVNGSSEVTCSLGNPLRGDSAVLVELDMSAVPLEDEFKEIRAEARTQSEEASPLDNVASLRIDCRADAELRVAGKAEEERYSYLESEANERGSKLFTFHHVYEVQKLGSSPVRRAALRVAVPARLRGRQIASIRHARSFVNNRKYDCVEEEVLGAEGEGGAARRSSTADLSLSCDDGEVACRRLSCRIAPLGEPVALARVIVTIDLEISNFTAAAREGRNIVYVSRAQVEVVEPNRTVGGGSGESQVATAFFSRREPEALSMWMILLSVLLGLVLLVMISSLLFKLGFFERRRAGDSQTTKLTDEVEVDRENREDADESVEEMGSITLSTRDGRVAFGC